MEVSYKSGAFLLLLEGKPILSFCFAVYQRYIFHVSSFPINMFKILHPFRQ